MANSGQFVFPSIIAPAPRIRSTGSESQSGIRSLYITDPEVVLTPFVLSESFIETGTPCNGPSVSPRITACSAVFADRNACSSVTVKYELRLLSSRDILSRKIRVISTGEIFFSWTRRRISNAPANAMSSFEAKSNSPKLQIPTSRINWICVVTWFKISVFAILDNSF